MGLLKKIESDIGICAALKCPHCLTESQFALRKLATTLMFHGVPLLDVDCSYQLFCTSCKYRKDMDDRELSIAMKAVKLYSRLAKQEIPATEYVRALEGLDFRSLNELQEAAKIWNCPSCNEAVPANFSECWKCKTPRRDLRISTAGESFKAPKLPDDVTRPVHPWE